MASDIDQAQRQVDEGFLRRGIRLGVLPSSASTHDLTISVRQKILDAETLRLARQLGLLPVNATVNDLSNTVREELGRRGLIGHEWASRR